MNTHNSHLLKILMIEDNSDLREIMHDMFEIMGHEAEVAANGIDGIHKAKEFHPDIIFCDIGLPDMEGYEVARRIRSDYMLEDIFMVALTGYTGSKEIELAIESGFDRYLSKPVGIDVLKLLFSEVQILRGLAPTT